MPTDKKEMKITYATMSAEQMADLHAALDAAIVAVKKDFGQTYPMMIDGKAVEAGEDVRRRESRSTRAWTLGHFQSGGREHVQQAVAAARAAYPAWSAPAVAGARRVPAQGRRRDPQAPLGAVGAHGLRGRQEPPRVRRRRRGDGRPDRVLLRPGRRSTTASMRQHGHARARRAEHRACCARTACGRSSRRSTSRSRSPAAPPAARSSPATPSSSSRRPTRR